MTRAINELMVKYPDRVPIIVTRNQNSATTPEIDKHKYLVPVDITVGQFLFVIRKRMLLSSERALFLFIDGDLVNNSEHVGIVYARHKSKKDQCLHVVYSCENTFG
jgi:GABA(A) receptor-associated protein